MSNHVTSDRRNKTVTLTMDVAEAKSLGEFLDTEGNDPTGLDLLIAAANLDGYGALTAYVKRPGT